MSANEPLATQYSPAPTEPQVDTRADVMNKDQPSPSIPAKTDGRIAIVTGGNTGIGYQIVRALIRTPGIARVYIASRTESKIEAAIEKLQTEAAGEKPAAKIAELRSLKLELSSVKGSLDAVEAFLKLETRLDLLVNNAAMLNGPYMLTDNGIVDTMQINYLGTFIFTNGLLPLMIDTSKNAGADVRIVILSSEAHRMVPRKVKPKWDSIAGWNDTFEQSSGLVPASQIRYSFSKMAIVLWANELQRRIDAQAANIFVLSGHPGGIITDNMISNVHKRIPTGFQTLTIGALYLFLGSAAKGALNPIYLATSPDIRQTSAKTKPSAEESKFKGGYFVPVGKKRSVDVRCVGKEGEKDARTLWDFTERVIEKVKETGGMEGL